MILITVAQGSGRLDGNVKLNGDAIATPPFRGVSFPFSAVRGVLTVER
ncbi:MAG TPA: hypothetical protein V6D43_20795 [Candidatus Sericytochromatia bacterium]